MNRPWDVLLIGGASGTGKSSLSYPLARAYGLPVLEVDDIVCAIKAMTTPQQQPALHFWDTHPQAHEMDAADIVAQGIELSEALHPALVSVIGNHLETDMPVVIEGDFLLPSIAVLEAYAGVPAAGRVRAVYVVEPDEDQVVANFLAREPDEGPQRKRAEVSVVWTGWLTAEAERCGVPVIPARPWPTLIDRVEATLTRI